MKKPNKYLGQPEEKPEKALEHTSTAAITALTAPAAPVPALDTLLSPYLNLTHDQKVVYYSWMLQQSLETDGLIPGLVTGGLPILTITGPQSCGKSVLTKITKGILVTQEWFPASFQTVPPQDIETYLNLTTILTYDNISSIPEQYINSLADLAKAGFDNGQGIILNGTGLTIPDKLVDYIVPVELNPLDKPVPEEDLLLSIGKKLTIIQQSFSNLKNAVFRKLVAQEMFGKQDYSQLPTHVNQVPTSLYNYYNVASAYLSLMNKAQES